MKIKSFHSKNSIKNFCGSSTAFESIEKLLKVKFWLIKLYAEYLNNLILINVISRALVYVTLEGQQSKNFF